jgi:PiT family inorganic phosphate transporter
VINGGVMGAGAAKRLSAVRWGVAGNIVVAWVLTLPCAAAVAAASYALTRGLGGGSTGPLLMFGAAVIALTVGIVLRIRGRLVPVAQS